MGKKNKKRASTSGDDMSNTSASGQEEGAFSGPFIAAQAPKLEDSVLTNGHLDDADSEDEMTPGAQGMLCHDYEIRVRPMIDLIDKLRRIGLDKELGLPSIVVVGDQSAGKSSVLEAISGIQLPRGSGIVTRCPLELRLKRSPSDEPWKAHIHYKSEGNGDVDLDVEGPDNIGEMVREAQDALAGHGKNVTTDLITLEVEAPDLPDLTLIDLPGIVRVAGKGQENIGPKIKSMIKGHIKKQETIILAVVPANVDLETSEALEMANDVDPNHQRTLGVITKCDMVDKGAEDGLLSVLNNDVYHLDKGYIAVKCRGQQAIKNNQTLKEALEEEQDFFAAAEHFRNVPADQYSIRSLSSRLTDELVEHIHSLLPGLREQVFSKRADVRQRLLELGEGIPTKKVEKSRYLMKILTEYTQALQCLKEGREDLVRAQVRLYNAAREAFETFSNEIRTKVRRKENSGAFRAEIREAMENDRGRELPRFIKFDTFRKIAGGIVKEFIRPSQICLETVAETVNRRLGQLAHQTFNRFPMLESKIMGLISSVMQGAMDRAHRTVTEAFKMEQLIFSQDRYFNDKLDDIIKEKLEDSPSTTQKTALGFLEVGGDSKDKEVETMFTVIQAYLQIAINRISDQIPMIILQHVVVMVTDELHTKVFCLLEESSGALDALKEEKNMKFKRDQLQASLHRLELAAEELIEFNPSV